MTEADYLDLRTRLAEADYDDEYDWSQNIKPPASADEFALEVAFVICNSGMKATIAEQINGRVRRALSQGMPVEWAFGHPGKAAAIQEVWNDRETWFALFNEADDKLTFCQEIPWIGPITKYHLAKNFGVDCAKPDRHLVRVANACGESCHDMCARLAAATGDRIATVDVVIWRAASLGWV